MTRPTLTVAAIPLLAAAATLIAPSARADEEEPACSLVPPGADYVVAIGYGDGGKVTALREAREDARERLLGQVCSGYVESRCERVGRFVRDWEQGDWDPGSRDVCALAALEREHLEALERDTRTFRKELDALARAATEQAGDHALRVDAPVWGGRECGGGAAGAVVAAELRNALARAEARVLIADSTDDAPAVRVQMAPSDHGIVVSAAVVFPGRPDGIGLPGTAASWDVLGVPRTEPCADATEALPSASAVPATGTVVVDGQPVEETHWIGGCMEPDAGQQAAMGLWNSLGGEATSDEDRKLGALVQGYLAESRALCQQYERFAIGASEYARRNAELSGWFRQVQEQVLLGTPGAPDRGQLLHGPGSVASRTLQVSAARLDGAPLGSGDQVTHDDRFKLHATVSQAAHLYVIYENSAGEIAVFPETSVGVMGMPGVPVQLPAPGFVFRVDEHGGRAEVVHVVASPHPLPVHSRPVSQLVGDVRRTRGLSVEPETVFTADGEVPWYGDPEATVSGYGAVLYTLVLDHQ